MDICDISEIRFNAIKWEDYDIIFFASGFEARSIHIFQSLPSIVHNKCIILGFHPKNNILSRKHNDDFYTGNNLNILTCNSPQDYEDTIKIHLENASNLCNGRPLRVFVDYSVMTRVWYAYILTWLRYADGSNGADIDFAYTHGEYEGDFSSFQIQETRALAGFEGALTGTHNTVALYGLGYDKYATLAVHELIQPDSFHCYIASDNSGVNNDPAKIVARENSEIIEQSGNPPLILPLSNIKEIVTKLTQLVDKVSISNEVMAVAMGPKTHVLGTLLVGHNRENLSCIHSLGERKVPVQVTAKGPVSCWRIKYRR